MPEYFIRLRRVVEVTELVDVKITAESPEEAREKVSELFDADEVKSTNDTDFGESLDRMAFKHDEDSDGWFFTANIDTKPLTYDGDSVGAVNLDVYTPVDEETGEE